MGLGSDDLCRKATLRRDLKLRLGSHLGGSLYLRHADITRCGRESLRSRKNRIEIHVFRKIVGIFSAPFVLSMCRNFTSWRNSVFHMPDDSEQGYPTRNLRVSLRAEN